MTKNDKKMTKKSQKKHKKTRKKGSKKGHFLVEKKMKKNGFPRIPGEVFRSAEKKVIFLRFKTLKSRVSKIGPKSVKTQGQLTKTWSGGWKKTKKPENDLFGGPKWPQKGSFFYHHMTEIFRGRGFGGGLRPPDPKMAILGVREKWPYLQKSVGLKPCFLSKNITFFIFWKKWKSQKNRLFQKMKKMKKWPKKVKFFFQKNHEKKKFTTFGIKTHIKKIGEKRVKMARNS